MIKYSRIKKRLLSIYFVFLLITAGFIGFLAFEGVIDEGGVEGAIIIVGSDQTYKTINDAITNSKLGDTILVNNGTYNESFNITKRIKLIGNSYPFPIISLPDNTSILINSAKVEIKNFEIVINRYGNMGTGSNSAILVKNENITIENVIIGGMSNSSFQYGGIYTYRNALNTKISNCSIFNLDKNGITITADYGNEVNNCTIYNCEWGIYIDNYYTTFFKNRIVGNKISNNQIGIKIMWGEENWVYNNYIQNNTIGLSIYSSNNHIYYNNILSNKNQLEGGEDNQWNNRYKEGNYWSDYTGTDDGSGDGKYMISGDGLGDTNVPHLYLDYYPFTEENGWRKEILQINDNNQRINGNWTINKFESVSNKIIVLSGNLIIETKGSLILDNITLIMNCLEDGQYKIEVRKGGTFTVINSKITTYDKYSIGEYYYTDYGYTMGLRYKFEVFGKMDINNCKIGYIWGVPYPRYSDKGGIKIFSDDVNISNSIIYNGGGSGINIIDADINVINCSIINCNYGIILENSDGIIKNNKIIDNDWGIFVKGSSAAIILDNNIQYAGYGINIENSRGLQIINNYIHRCWVAMNCEDNPPTVFKGNIIHYGDILYHAFDDHNIIIENNSILGVVDCQLITFYGYNSTIYKIRIGHDSSVILINTTYTDIERPIQASESYILSSYLLTLKVYNNTGIPIPNAEITITYDNGESEKYYTNSNGTSIIIIKNNKVTLDGTTNYGNFNLLIEYNNQKYEKKLIINKNKEMDIYLNTPIIIDDEKPSPNNGNTTSQFDFNTYIIFIIIIIILILIFIILKRKKKSDQKMKSDEKNYQRIQSDQTHSDVFHSEQRYLCATCGIELTYYPQINRYYCYHCKKYE